MDSQDCKAPGCDREKSAKGFCNMHYNRWKRHGDPTVARRMVLRGSSLRERIEQLRSAGDESQCWEWQGTIHHSGYGHLQVDGVQKSAHVWAYIDANGPIPDGLFVLHSCDNRKCVNPTHLRLGTHQDNMNDKVERNRCSRLRGERAPSRKLTEEQAVEIIRRHATENIAVGLLAADYGISEAQVHNIIRGKRWIDLDHDEILKGIM